MKLPQLWTPLLLALALLNPLPAQAGGSFRFEDVEPLLRQNEALYIYVTETLELSPGGWANRINGRVSDDLGGSRLAPYVLRAKPKGTTGGWIFYLSIEADIQFLDADGKEVVEMHEGKTIKETLTGISLKPIPESEKAKINK